MKPKISNSSKFAIIAIKTYSDLFFEDCIQLTNGLIVYPHLPTKLDDFWISSIGTIQAEEISDSNLFFFISTDDSSISENELSRFLFMFYNSLLLQGVGYTNQGFTLQGKVMNNLFNYSSISSEFTFKRPPKIHYDAYTLKQIHLENAVNLSKGISQIYKNDIDTSNKDYLRLRKGFSAFLDGIKTSDVRELHKRLPFFVKAIEAIIKPDKAYTQKQFAHRCKFFGGDSELNREIYNEIYEMRSSAEHLNPMEETLTKYQNEKVLDIMCLRTYQIELIASHLYQLLLTDDSLLENFTNDSSISTFWKKQDHELKILFGKSIDFNKISQKWFLDWVDGWY